MAGSKKTTPTRSSTKRSKARAKTLNAAARTRAEREPSAVAALAMTSWSQRMLELRAAEFPQVRNGLERLVQLLGQPGPRRRACPDTPNQDGRLPFDHETHTGADVEASPMGRALTSNGLQPINPGPICQALTDTPAGDYLSALAYLIKCEPISQNDGRIITSNSTDMALNRIPNIADIALLGPVAAATVDGEPFMHGGSTVQLFRRVSQKDVPPGQQRLFAGPRTIGGREIDDVMIRGLASLPRTDLRSPHIGDVYRLGSLVYALVGPSRISAKDGAVFLCGSNTPESRRRWWNATRLIDSMSVTIDPSSGRWIKLAVANPCGDDSIVIAAPGWWNGRSWRPSRALFRSPSLGTHRAGGTAGFASSLFRVLAGLEARMCWTEPSGLGSSGRIPSALVPASKGGAGPPLFVNWKDVSTLAGEWIPPETRRNGTERRRYSRWREELLRVGYLVPTAPRSGLRGEAAAGDSVEIVEVVSGRRGQESGLRIRASARFCAAVEDQRWAPISLSHVTVLAS